MPEGVTITSQQMYELLLQVDRKVTGIVAEQRQQSERLADHEERLRAIEAEEDLTRRIADMETDLKGVVEQLRELQKRVWAIPGASVLIAAGAVILTLIRTY